MTINVVIPLYNKAATITRALQSVFSQTRLPDEVVIIDDGSTDHGADVVRSLTSTPLPVRLIQQKNQGVSAARNRGIAEAQGDWIAFLDADDRWEPTFIETILRLHATYPQAHLCATAYGHTDQRGVSQGLTLNHLTFTGEEGLMDNYFHVAAHSHPPLWTSAICARKESLLAIGGFPLGVKAGEDLLTWARLALRGKIAYCTLPLATYFPERESYYSRPSRTPQEEDPVGHALAQMLAEHPSEPGLQEYLAHWHKMRASIYLRLPHEERHCRQEVGKALALDPSLRSKLRLYKALTLIPYPLRMKLFSHQS